MPLIDNVNQYPVVDKYWDLIKRTPGEVFKEKTDSVDTLRKEVSQRPADEQLQFYHAEPLDIAADLAGKRKVWPPLQGSQSSRARRSALAGRSLARSRVFPPVSIENRAASRARCAQRFGAIALRPRSALRRSALARAACPERQRKGTD